MANDRSVLTTCLHDLFHRQLHAVLATADGGVPHACLVAFAASPDLRRLVFTTARATKKFRNLAASGTVALLIDNRTNTASDVAEAMAVTVVGRAGEATGGSANSCSPCSLPATRAWRISPGRWTPPWSRSGSSATCWSTGSSGCGCWRRTTWTEGFFPRPLRRNACFFRRVPYCCCTG